MFDRHRAEITVMQFTGHSLLVHQSDCTVGFYLVPYCQPNPPTPMEYSTSASLEWHVWSGWRSIYNTINIRFLRFGFILFDEQLVFLFLFQFQATQNVHTYWLIQAQLKRMHNYTDNTMCQSCSLAITPQGLLLLHMLLHLRTFASLNNLNIMEIICLFLAKFTSLPTLKFLLLF